MHDGNTTSPMYMADILASHLHLTLYTIPPLLSNRIGIPEITQLENSNSDGDRCTLIGLIRRKPSRLVQWKPKCTHIAPVASLFIGNIVPLLCFPSLCFTCHCHMNKLNSYKVYPSQTSAMPLYTMLDYAELCVMYSTHQCVVQLYAVTFLTL